MGQDGFGLGCGGSERETYRTHHDTNRRRNMSKKILLLGLSDSVLADAQQQLARPDLEVFRGTSVEDVRSTMAQTTIDHVFMGGGLPSKPQLQMEMVWAIFQSSGTTTVHMLDTTRGPQGFVLFVQGVLRGLTDSEG